MINFERKQWYLSVHSVSNRPIGTEFGHKTENVGNMGYASVQEMQKTLIHRFKNSSKETYEKIANGIRITEKGCYMGMRTIVEYVAK